MQRISNRKRQVTAKNATKILSREDVLGMLGGVITEMVQKIRTGRIRDTTKFAQRIRQIRSLGYTANIYLNGLKDEELSKVMKTLEELEKLAKDQDAH